jgi:hypothetical protein
LGNTFEEIEREGIGDEQMEKGKELIRQSEQRRQDNMRLYAEKKLRGGRAES